MDKNYFTDLAAESRDLWRRSSGQEHSGAAAWRDERLGCAVETVEIRTAEAERELGKPVGRYATVELDALFSREEDAFSRLCTVLSEELSSQLGLSARDTVLVAALGNDAVTPDALGALCGEHLLVTRHLKERMPEDFARFRSVAFFASGVLGTTGVESGELIRAVVDSIRPSAVIAVDALCARETRRLCRAVQIADSGIVPGSGVGNARMALTRASLGVPVVSVGVPTVVDARTLCEDLTGQRAETFPRGELFVTPRDIDAKVRECARLLGYAIDLAVHPGLGIGDVDALLR